MDLIRKNSCKADEASYSFMSLSGVKATFGVNPDKMPQFLADYCKIAMQDEENFDTNNPTKRLHALNLGEELIKKTAPITAVLAFKFSLPKDEADDMILINSKFIKALVYTYQRTIVSMFKINEEMRELTAVVLETPVWYSKKSAYITIELRFPYCQIDRRTLERDFRDNVIDQLRSANLFSHLEIQPVGDWNDIIQANTNFITLYRSVVDPSIPPHSLSYIYGPLKNISDEDAEIELQDVFNPKDHTYLHSGEISTDFLEESKELQYWLPLFLSAFFWSKVAQLREDPINERKIRIDEDEEEEEGIHSLSKARMFLDLIKVETIQKDNYWKDIGRVLYNMTKGLDEGLEMFIEVSARCPGSEVKEHDRSKASCNRVWRSLRNSPLTVRTLGWMAKLDDPASYSEWHISWVNSAVDSSITDMTDLDMAEIVYRFYWLDFICTDMTNNKWWYYTRDTHRYVQTDKAVRLLNGITDQIIPELCNLRKQASVEQVGLSKSKKNAKKEKDLEEKIKQICSLIKKFKSHGTRTRVVSMCKEKFYLEDFKKIINKNNNLTAWPNCVVEVCGNKAIPRPGKPEDYLTKCGMVPYRTDFSYDHPTVKELLLYLDQVFPDKDLNRFFKKDIASFLIAGNPEKFWRVWTGIKGNNSKSMMVKLMQLWWGELCIDIPDTVYSGAKRSSSGPSPELAQMESARLGITAEPDDGDDLKAGFIKRSSGNDRFFGRGCNENGGSIDLVYRSIYMCNSVPNITNVDGPTKERILFLLFLSRWVNNPPSDPSEQRRLRLFKKDKFFENRLPDLAEAIFWLAVEWYPAYKEEGLEIVPKIVKEYTEKHWREHDPYECFISERLKQVEVEEGDKPTCANSITASDAYNQFKSYFRESYPQSKMTSCPQFITQLDQRIGERVNHRWLGWVICDQV